jgi:hypothetical protein
VTLVPGYDFEHGRNESLRKSLVEAIECCCKGHFIPWSVEASK